MELIKADEPIVTGMHIGDGLFIKEYRIAVSGTILPQHSHTYSHVSGIVAGGVRLMKDGDYMGDFFAPCRIVIEAHAKHLFMTLTDDTAIWCIHASANGEDPDIHEEHQIIGAA